jgi:hypothetical protein
MDVRTGHDEDAVFRLETVFVGRTTGAGVLRDGFGHITGRFNVDTIGVRDEAYGAIILEETFAYEDGAVEAMRWVVTAAGPQRYVLAEAQAGSGIVAHSHAGEVVFAYRRPFGAARGPATPRFAVRMTLLSPETVLKEVRVSVLGVPVASVTAVHRRIA